VHVVFDPTDCERLSVVIAGDPGEIGPEFLFNLRFDQLLTLCGAKDEMNSVRDE
jgi:hypothetical protein